MNKTRGYFGIGIYQTKTAVNVGTLWRSAQNFGADFIFTIGKRYIKESTDTTKATRHVPLYHYTNFEDFEAHLPKEARLVFVEQTKDSKNIGNYIHPERAIYILGAEDNGITENIMRGHQKIFIDTPMCLNVAIAGSIVLYDRTNKKRI